MAVLTKTLGYGTVNAGANPVPLYTVVSPAKSAIVSSVRLVNPSTQGATVNLYAKKSGTQGNGFRIAQMDYSLAAGAMLLMEDPVTLGLGDLIQVIVTGTGSSASYMVNGVERDS